MGQQDIRYLPEGFSNILRKKGYLSETGSVIDVKKEQILSEGGSTFRVFLTYENGSPTMPHSFYVKQESIMASRNEHYKRLAYNEVDFYRYFSKELKTYLPECILAEYETSGTRLILMDLSDKYECPMYEDDLSYYETAIETLATLQSDVNKLSLSENRFNQHGPWDYQKVDISAFIAMQKQFLTSFTDDLPEEYLEYFARTDHFFTHRKDEIDRYLEQSTKTIVHGDLHLKNCLFSKEDKKKDMKLIDWQWWNYGIGTYDIAHLLNLYLPSRFKDKEIHLVRRYYERSQAEGMKLSWDECLWQYQLFTMLNVYKPAIYSVHCKLRRKKQFWIDFYGSILNSYKNFI